MRGERDGGNNEVYILIEAVGFSVLMGNQNRENFCVIPSQLFSQGVDFFNIAFVHFNNMLNKLLYRNKKDLTIETNN